MEHLASIKSTVAQDAATYGDRFTVKADGKETIDLLEPTPLISMLAGELIYQLRSALDHLAFDLVQMNRSGIAFPANWEENCMFPIWTNPLKPGQKPPLPYGTFKRLPGIPIDVHTIIERVQPYYPAGTGAINTSLKLLNNLSNIDKHRRFALTVTRAQIRHNLIHKSGVTGYSIETLEHGAEISMPYAGEDDPIVEVERSTTLAVAFNERNALGDASGVPIDHLLEMILSEVWMEVVTPLRKFLN
jgi:hypothetical protein